MRVASSGVRSRISSVISASASVLVDGCGSVVAPSSLHATASKRGRARARRLRLRDVLTEALSNLERSGLSLERVGMSFGGGLRGIFSFEQRFVSRSLKGPTARHRR